jgi:hypothetical protein
MEGRKDGWMDELLYLLYHLVQFYHFVSLDNVVNLNSSFMVINVPKEKYLAGRGGGLLQIRGSPHGKPRC